MAQLLDFSGFAEPVEAIPVPRAKPEKALAIEPLPEDAVDKSDIKSAPVAEPPNRSVALDFSAQAVPVDFSRQAEPVAAEPSWGDYAREGVKDLARGALETVASGARGVAAMRTVLPEDIEPIRTGIGRVRQMSGSEYRDYLGQIDWAVRDPAQRADLKRIAETTRKGGAPNLDLFANTLSNIIREPRARQPEYKVGQKLEDFSNKTFGAKPGWGSGFFTDVMKGAGSTLPFLGTAVLGPLAGPATGFIGGGLMGSGQQADDAEQKLMNGRPPFERTPDIDAQIRQAAQLGLIPGSTEQAPIEVLLHLGASRIPVLNRIANSPGLRNAFLRIGGKALAQVIAEGGQEGAQQWMQNVIAKLTYDPSQKLSDQVLYNALIGGIVGGGIGAPVAAVEEMGRGHQAAAASPALGAPPQRVEPRFIPPTPVTPAPAAPISPPQTVTSVTPTPLAPQVVQPVAPQAPTLQPSQAVTLPGGMEATLRGAGYSAQQILDMNPEERSQAVLEAQSEDGSRNVSGYAPDNTSLDFSGQAIPVQSATADVSHGTMPAEGPVEAVPPPPPEARPQPAPSQEPSTASPGPNEAATTTANGDGTRASPVIVQSEPDLETAREKVNTEPSPAQAEAGNYQMGHVKVAGLDVTIETPKGASRSGADVNGNNWVSPPMPADYGYVKRSKGADGDHVDVFIGPNPESSRVYVIDQIDPATGKFDEHKAIVATDSPGEAGQLYRGSFSDQAERIGGITEMSTDEFKEWLKTGATTKSLSGEALGNGRSVQTEKRPFSTPIPDFSAQAEPVEAPANTEPAPVNEVLSGTSEAPSKQPVTGFQTAKGSTYELGPNLNTTRNKAPRSDIGHEGDFGPKPTSARTYYITEENAQRLAPPQGEFRVIDHADGTISLATRNGKAWGIAKTQRGVPFSNEPREGMVPLEVWDNRPISAGTTASDAYRKAHFGNQITSLVRREPVESAKSSQVQKLGAASGEAPDTLQAADTAYRAASARYQETAKRYRAREIGDEEFLAVRQERDAALATWEAAQSAAEPPIYSPREETTNASPIRGDEGHVHQQGNAGAGGQEPSGGNLQQHSQERPGHGEGGAEPTKTREKTKAESERKTETAKPEAHGARAEFERKLAASETAAGPDGQRYRVQETDRGWVFKTAKVTKGGGYPARWSRDEAIGNAAKDAGFDETPAKAHIEQPKEPDHGERTGSLGEPAPAVSRPQQPENAPSPPEGGQAPELSRRAGIERGGNAPADRQSNVVELRPAGQSRGAGEAAGGHPQGGGRAGHVEPGQSAAPTEVKQLDAERSLRAARNYRITADDKIGQGGPKEKVRNNIAAIRALKQVLQENRPATPEEKRVLVKYVGWGAFAQDVFAEYKPEWAKERAQIKDLLSPEEYAAARASTLNAHYTSEAVIKGMWGALEHLGFQGGRALEPSSGVGHFIGLVPDSLVGKTAWSAVELDPTTGNITKLLYDGSDVNVQGFETFQRPNDFYDLAISNVPFGNYKLTDKKYPPLSIHNYFFVKSLDKVRPGGMVAFITSSFTMDSETDRARAEIQKRGDLVGAIRLPGGKKGAFAGNAGTDVTTDILFLRKRGPGEPAPPFAQAWSKLKEITTTDGPTRINEYFADHPKMMLGEMRLTSSHYGADKGKGAALEGPTDNLDQKIAEAARTMPQGALTARIAPAVTEREPAVADAQGHKAGAFFAKDGKLFRSEQGVGVETKLHAPDAERVKALLPIRDTVNELLANQAQGKTEGNDALRRKLNKQYDTFTKAYGPINLEKMTATAKGVVVRRYPNFRALKTDPDAFKVAAIENYNPDTGKAAKAAIFTTDIVGKPVEPDIRNPGDTITVSLNRYGELRVPDMAKMLGISEADLIGQLGDLIYRDPKGETWQLASAYLAGDVVTKLEDALGAAKADKSYERNVEALRRVQPKPLTQAAITPLLGSTWVPVDVYESFIRDALGGHANLSLNPITKRWSVTARGLPQSVQIAFGTPEVSAGKIIEAALNSTPITVKDREGKTQVAETDAARLKIEDVRDRFHGNPDKGMEGWVYQDQDRADRIAGIYNDQFNRLVSEQFDGAHQTLPGMARTIKSPTGELVPFELFTHQKNAIWRIVQKGNTLLAHVVGAGKTFTMIGAGMEMRRLGQIQRPMYAVPNHMLEQFSREFLQAYPSANILVASKDDMSADKRRAFAGRIAAQQWDGIVITHDAFGRLRMSRDAYAAFLNEEISEILDAQEAARQEEGRDNATIKELEKLRKNAEERLKKLLAEERKDEGVTFEELGVDQIFVDEAHLFKNLSFFTRHTRVKGVTASKSQRATDLFLKIKHMEKLRPGHSAVFATGTPISNTMAEMYTMQRYLQMDALKAFGVDRFDAWASSFGNIVTRMELAPDGRSFKPASSFSKFVNLPELVNMYGLVADTQTAAMLNLPTPKLKGGKVQVIEAEPSAQEEEFIQSVVRRADGPFPADGSDNMLVVVTDGRKAATDGRLVGPDFAFNPNGKVALAVNKIAEVYRAGKAPGLAQLVFLDMGTPKKGKAQETSQEDGEEADIGEEDAQALASHFDLYNDLRNRLVKAGIRANEIAFIHEADNDAKKGLLFQAVRDGKVRVLIGSTGKMGVGTNVQRQLIAMHHLDAPWRPADIEQRDGRILRQGNLNPEVQIYRYITKRTFDGYMWQTLERKAAFIGQLYAGQRGVRQAEDVDTPIPEAAMLKAAATGDPRIMEHAALTRKARDLEIARASHFQAIAQANRQVKANDAMIAHFRDQATKAEEDATKVPDTTGDKFKITLAVGTKGTVTSRKTAGEAIRNFLLGQTETMWEAERSFKIGTLGSLDVRINVQKKSAYPSRSVEFYLQPVLKGAGEYLGTQSGLTPETDPVGLIQRVENLAESIPASGPWAKNRISQYEKENASLAPQAKASPFARQGELDKAQRRLSELATDLAAAKAEEAKHPKPAPREFRRYPRASVADIGSPVINRLPPAQRERLVADIQEASRRILGRHIRRVHLSPTLAMPGLEGKEITGVFTAEDKTIYLAFEGNGTPHSTLRHESIHAMREAGLITKPEWSALSRAARERWIDEFDIRRKYRDYRAFAQNDAEFEEMLVEEGVAAAAAAHYERGQHENLIARIFDKIQQFLEAVRNLLAGHGFTSATDIFDLMEQGGMAERPANYGVPRPSFAQMAAIVPQRMAARVSTNIDTLRWAFQDRMLDVKRAQEATGRPTPISTDTYLAESLFHGRTGKALEDLRRDTEEPIIQAIHDRKLSLEQVDDYLYARHAPERNAYIASINPKLPDSGSGMSDAEAQQVIDGFTQAGKLADLEHVAQMIDRLQAETRNRLLRAGLISQDMADAWKDAYQHYVPLRGFEADPENEEIPRTGKRFDIRGKEAQAALGRRSKADSPLTYIMMQAEQAIIRAEKNKVGKTFLRFVEANPDSSLWEVNRKVVDRYLDKNTGMVREVRRIEDSEPNVLAVKVGGKQYYITIHDKRLAQNLKGMGADTLGSFGRALATLNRYLAWVNTGLNLEFVISNLFRDLQTASIHLTQEDRKGLIKDVLKDVPRAIKGVWSGQKGDRQSQWAQHYHEYADAGGKVGFYRIKDIENQKAELRWMMRRLQTSPGMTALNVLRALDSAIENANGAIENGVRLATFAHLRQRGVPAPQAASVALELTVNFTRKGEYGAMVNALYLFYNAGLQGSVRMVQALGNRRVRKIALGIVVGSALLEFLNGLLSGDDDDDKKFYDKIPDWEKERNLILMLPGSDRGSYLKIPLPWGYNVFAVTGQKIGAVLRGAESPLKAALTVVDTAFNAFNPLGSGSSFASFVTPTILDPIVELYANQDYLGRKIMPDTYDTPPPPDSQRFWSSVNPASKAIAQGLNRATGGNEVEPGAIDISPETFDYWANFVAGGAGAFLTRTENVVSRALLGQPIEAQQIPFVRRVYGEKSTAADRQAYYEIRDKAEIAAKLHKVLRQEGDQAGLDDMAGNRQTDLSMVGPVKHAEGRLKKLRARERKIEGSKQPAEAKQEQLDEIGKRRDQIMLHIRKLYNQRAK